MMRHKPMYYFETTQCMPTLDDGTCVLLFSTAIKQWVPVATRIVLDMVDYYKAHYSHWMQMPKSPSPTDTHAFLDI